MHFNEALRTINGARAGGARVSFVSPALSVCLAAERTRSVYSVLPLQVEFQGDAARYADHVGLVEALAGRAPVHRAGALHGRSYSPLEWLYTHEHVDRCTETIGELFKAQLGDSHPLRGNLTKIAGELHDNVASHSRGRGFAAAQVYGNRIEYAIADAGCGLLRNARKIDPALKTDFEGIAWSFVRGNTSWRPPDKNAPEPQRGLGGAEIGHYVAAGDSHAGWGLAELQEMIDATKGEMWVASGAAGYTYSQGTWTPFNLTNPWAGLFIEFQVPRGA